MNVNNTAMFNLITTKIIIFKWETAILIYLQERTFQKLKMSLQQICVNL